MSRATSLALAILSGLLLFASDFPVHFWPLQLFALIPVLWCLSHTYALGWAFIYGAAMGASFLIPLVIVLGFPWQAAVPLATFLIVVWGVAATLWQQFLRAPSVAAAFACAAAAVLIELAQVSIFPVWGTAQSFVRVWSASPLAIQFVRWTGFSGIVFMLVGLQALFVVALRSRRPTWPTVAALAMLLVVAGANLWSWRQKPVGHITVAAIGWTVAEATERGLGFRHEASYDSFVEPLVGQAAKAGARVVVTPELAFATSQAATILRRASRLADAHQIYLALSYFDQTSQTNRLVWFGPQGQRLGDYEKNPSHPLCRNLSGWHGRSGDPGARWDSRRRHDLSG